MQSAGSSAGPTGILGTNKRDAEETVACLVEDLQAQALRSPELEDREQFDTLLGERQPNLVTLSGWRAIDSHELGRGRDQQRPRVKLSSHDELLAAAAER